MKNVLEQDIVVFDVETGGLDESQNSLLQIGFTCLNDNNEGANLSINIKEEVYRVSSAAMKHNGLNLVEIYDKGVTKQEAVFEIISFLDRNYTSKPILLGHNLWLDKNFTRELFKSQGYDMNDYFHHRMIDTMSIIHYLNALGLLPFEACSSTGAFKYFGIEVDGRHTGLGDAIATKKLFKKLIELGQSALIK